MNFYLLNEDFERKKGRSVLYGKMPLTELLPGQHGGFLQYGLYDMRLSWACYPRAHQLSTCTNNTNIYCEEGIPYIKEYINRQPAASLWIPPGTRSERRRANWHKAIPILWRLLLIPIPYTMLC